MKYQKYEGIIINRHSVKDGDRFFTIFTREEGKISVYSRSVRSTKSKRSASLDLYNHIKFEVSAHGQYKTLTHVELVSSFREGKRKLTDISRLFVIGELINSFLPEEDPNLEVFDLLLTALKNLAHFETPEYLVRFKKKLLIILGFWNDDTPDQDIDRVIESLLDRQLRSSENLMLN